SMQGGDTTVPTLAWSIPNYGPVGFYQNYNGAIWFTSNGQDEFYLGDEGGMTAPGGAPILSFQGTNRGTVEALNALVLRSLASHFELEGGSSVSTSVPIGIVPYKGGTSTGVPCNFVTDPTTLANW